jgi:histone acetyltransferase (RNA polymerase elongator complex component)
MPWKESTIMEQKIEFICEWRSGNYTITELCRSFEISRPTAYKIIAETMLNLPFVSQMLIGSCFL